MRTLIHLLCLATLSFALTACPSKPNPSGSNEVYVVMGDPRKVIEGATLNSQIDMKFFDESQKLFISGGLFFSEKEKPKKNKTQKEMEDENAPSKETNNEAPAYDVKLGKDKDGSEIVIIKNKQFTFLFSNRVVNGKKIFHVKNNNATETGELLHFSQSADKRNVSFLLISNDKESGTTLGAIYFTKGSNGERVRGGAFNYVSGTGIKITWPKSKPISLNVCGANAQGINGQIEEATQKWNTALKPRQVIDLKVVEEYFPFSDLNQQCLYYVDSYLMIAGADRRYGLAFGIEDGASTFVDSDIFIFKSELAKEEIFREMKLRRAILHEMGHFLGLDHQFDGTPSVMSYDFSDGGNLSDYDISAIQELYK